ncbi:hypothetical protein FDZ71_12455, partial [bacterium]
MLILFWGRRFGDGILGVLRDYTTKREAEETRKRLEEQLHHARKLEAVGTLAGGVAHEFNNILSIILGRAEIAEYVADDEESRKKSLSIIVKTTLRAKDLVRKLLMFSSKEIEMAEYSNMKASVDEAIALVRTTIPSFISITSDIEECGSVYASSTEIHQIILNLCTNAYHAIGDRAGFIELSLRKVDVTVTTLLDGLTPGPYALLTVRDDGVGLDDETRLKIFEPFYTTKGPSKGTGLGLSVVHGIIKSRKGSVNVSSKLGKGSAFFIYLPIAGGVKQNEVSMTSENRSDASLKILVVDDEQEVRDVHQTLISSLGHMTECAEGPEEAIALTKKEKFDIV